MELKPIMFEKGKSYKCLKTLNIMGIVYFIQGNEYECKTDNCLVTELGEENFITHNYLPYFFD